MRTRDDVKTGAALRAAGLLAALLAAAGAAAEEGRARLAVEDPRPVAKALEELEALTGRVLTYEDPVIAHESEVRDVTLEVRRDLDAFPPGQAPKVLIPKGGRIDLDYEAAEGTGRPRDPAGVVRTLLVAHHAAGNPGVFRLEETGPMIHVVPLAAKSGRGELATQRPLLDTPITLAPEDRTGYGELEAITEALARASGTRVLVGTVPPNLLLRHRSRLGAANEPARAVLARALLRHPQRLSWQLLHDPGLGFFALNIHVVAAR